MLDRAPCTTRGSISFLDAGVIFKSEQHCSAWRDIVSTSMNLRIALQTPEWAKFRCQFAGRGLIGFRHDKSGQIVNVIPLITSKFPLFSLFWSWRPSKIRSSRCNASRECVPGQIREGPIRGLFHGAREACRSKLGVHFRFTIEY